MSDVCKHCVAAPCQQSCPTGALISQRIRQRIHSAGYLQRLRLLRGRLPVRRHHPQPLRRPRAQMHAVLRSPERWLVPACAKACPTQSIQFGPIDDCASGLRRRVGELHERGLSSAYLYGDAATETYSELNSFYLLIDRPDVYGLPATPFNPWLHMPGDYARAVIGVLASLAVVLIASLSLGALTCRPRATPTTRRPNRRLGTPLSSGICSSITWRPDCFWSRPRPNWRRPARSPCCGHHLSDRVRVLGSRLSLSCNRSRRSVAISPHAPRLQAQFADVAGDMVLDSAVAAPSNFGRHRRFPS